MRPRLRRPGRPILVVGLLALVLAPGAASKGAGPHAAPVVTFACTPAPVDCTGWYRTNVTIRWTVDQSATKTVGCNTDTITTDTTGTVESCYAENQYGQSTLVRVTLRVDKTLPALTGAHPDRAPDANGWYNHPLTVAFQGVDSTSGVAGCSVSRYAGPTSAAAAVSGTCSDRAGNTSPAQSYVFKYDATPPALRAAGSALNRAVVLQWRTSSNTQLVSIHRALASKKGSRQSLGPRVYQGAGKAFRDRHLRNGVAYVYSLLAVSEAGLVSSTKISATPTALFNPSRGARVHRPPLLRWGRVRRASYYNVQLFRNGKKVLSAWPTRTSLRLHWRWSFERRHYRLSPGRYDWFVWPGFGAPAATKYGRLLGQNHFTVGG
jgi:hypothetical protein